MGILWTDEYRYCGHTNTDTVGRRMPILRADDLTYELWSGHTNADTSRHTISVFEGSFWGCLVSGFCGCGERYAR